MFDVKGKVALVTGAASGIGFAFAKELLRNAVKGVAIVDIDDSKGHHAVEEFTKEFGKDSAVFVCADVTNVDQMKHAFEYTVKRFGQIDIVINNAGVIQERQWEKCVAVNFVGVIAGSMLAIEQYLPKYKSGHEAVIVNTASLTGLAPLQEGPVYSATKSGVIAFTRAMGGNTRYQTTKVRMLAICPGCTDTNIFNMNQEQIKEPYLSLFMDHMRKIEYQTPQAVAKTLIDIIKNAPTGSVWKTINEECVEVEFPKLIYGVAN